jgi:hypothetical protein
MSDGSPASKEAEPGEDKPSQGTNLWLFYSLLGVALLVAMGIATLIVLPFYRHRH